MDGYFDTCPICKVPFLKLNRFQCMGCKGINFAPKTGDWIRCLDCGWLIADYILEKFQLLTCGTCPFSLMSDVSFAIVLIKKIGTHRVRWELLNTICTVDGHQMPWLPYDVTEQRLKLFILFS